MYKLRYLPLARKDLNDITDYIAEHLKAPKAAMDLLDSIATAISNLEQFPYSCKEYSSIQK